MCFTAEDGEWKPWAFEGWRRCFGTLSEPTFPWGFVRADNCQFAGAVGRGSPLAEKSCFCLSDFSLSAAGLRCGKPDALGNVPRDHGKSKVTNYNLQGAAVCAALPDIGLRGGSDSSSEGVRSLPAAAGPVPAPPQPVPEMPLPDVKSGEDISPAERAKLDKEVEAYALEMEAFWKAKADARDWDSGAPKRLPRARSLRWKRWASSPSLRPMTRRGRTLTIRPDREPLGALNPEGFRVVGLRVSGLGWLGGCSRRLWACGGLPRRLCITRGGFPRRFRVTRGGLPRCSVRTRGGVTSKRRPSCLSGLVRSFRRQCERRSAAFCVGVEGRRLGGVTLECLAPPLSPLHFCALPAANSPAFSVDSCTALTFGSLTCRALALYIKAMQFDEKQ